MPHQPEQRRQQAIARYLAGENIEDICREMGCSKSWLYKWKKRYQATDPQWAQERSRRPETTPAKTPAAVETAIVRLHETLTPGASGTVSARVIRDHLRRHHAEPIPSLRTIYRILNRQDKKGTAPACTSEVSVALSSLDAGDAQRMMVSPGRPLLTQEEQRPPMFQPKKEEAPCEAPLTRGKTSS